MTQSRQTFLFGLAAAALVQTAALSWIVFDRDRLLKNGREVVMQVTPVDPRDMFRGDYVILGNPLSLVLFERDKLGPIPPGLTRGSVIYVVAAPRADDSWEIRNALAAYPAAVAAGEVVLKGRITRLVRNSVTRGEVGGNPFQAPSASVRYGIESYFVPEGEGKALEAEVATRTVKAVLAVGPGGTAAIKALIVDGKRVETPAIF